METAIQSKVKARRLKELVNMKIVVPYYSVPESSFD